MIINVMSRENAVKYSFDTHKEKVAVLSISDSDKEFPRLENNPDNGIIWRCKVKFDDVEKGEKHCITEEDALNIYSFVTSVAESYDTLIVHCEAGVSRSAGVAAAIMKAINGDDWDVFSNPKYVPNMTCYRTVLNTFFQIEEDRRGLWGETK